ncbi:MAG: hypothetical protein AAFO03_26165 [Bacteroidota bacterium]
MFLVRNELRETELQAGGLPTAIPFTGTPVSPTPFRSAVTDITFTHLLRHY